MLVICGSAKQMEVSSFVFTEHLVPGKQPGGAGRRPGGRPSKLQKQNPAYFMFCVRSHRSFMVKKELSLSLGVDSDQSVVC